VISCVPDVISCIPDRDGISCLPDVIRCVPDRDGIKGQAGAEAQGNGVAVGFTGADDGLVRHKAVVSDPGAEGSAVGT